MSERKGRPRRSHGARPAADDIDARYGLEPVIDVADGGSALLEGFVPLRCPYCDESYGVAVDLSGGSTTYIEDCQVCCQPISLSLRVNDAGEFDALQAERIDR